MSSPQAAEARMRHATRGKCRLFSELKLLANRPM
jgi:hypothetical protein